MSTLTSTDASDLFRAPPARFVDVDSGQVAYRKVGSGPDVLFVHGWPASGATFRALLPYLTPHLTCHLVDLVGTGSSRFDRSTALGIGHHIHSVRRLVEQLEFTDVAVVGHDSGGLIARHALAGDARVRAMALIDTELPQGANWRFKQFLVMSRLPGFEDMLAWAGNQRALRRNRFLLGDCFADPQMLDGEFSEFFLEPLRDDPELRWAAGRLIKSFDLADIARLRELHAKIDVPVQLVWGSDDPFFPVKQAQEMVGTFPRASLHIIEGGKLFVHEEFPEPVAKAMLPVLTSG